MEFLEVPIYDDDIFKLLVRLAIDLTFLSVIVVFAIYPNQREREFAFTAVMLNVIVFFICFTMKKLELDLGLALGLFAVFGVLRYRTDAIRPKEMTYLFLVMGIAVINSLSNTKTSYAEIVLVNSLIFLAAMLKEWFGPERGPGRPQGRGGFRPQSHLTLLTMPEVRKELAITPQQTKSIDELLRDWQNKRRTAFESMFRNAPRDEQARRKLFETAQREAETLNSETEQKLDKLLDAKQRKRFSQLKIQRDGIAAFSRPAIVKRLSLTDEQVRKIRTLQEQSRRPSGAGRPDVDRIEKQRLETLKNVVAVLTDQQKSVWATLSGKQFEFPSQPRSRRGPGGGGPGGPREKVKLVKKYDQDKNGWLNQTERKAARVEAKTSASSRRRFGPPGGRFRGPGTGGPGIGGPGRGGPGRAGRGRRGPGRTRERPKAKPGPRVSPQDVESYAGKNLYDPAVLRTLFFEFENQDWELELQDFHGTDVDVPATLIVDGKKYPNVGVRFRGMSSYGTVPAGYKRSFNVSLDLADKKQRLYGYNTLNLLNSHGDPSYMSTVLYSHIARQYIPAPKANHVRVVVNGESWGIYVNAQQFNKSFLKEHFKSSKGTRWKVRGNPRADGGLRYVGDAIDEYKSRFDMKSNDGKKEWKALINLCRVLNKEPLDKLEGALAPILDIDGVLRFLALDVALVNRDGYWTRASDYSLFRDKQGKFHVFPHDMNETLRAGGRGRRFGPGGPPPGIGGFGRPQQGDRAGRAGRRDGNRRGRGPGGPGGPGGASVDLDPLVGLDNPRMPLRSRLLAIPRLRAKYLAYVRQIAKDSLDWKTLGPVISRHRELIRNDVEADTRKLDSYEAFLSTTAAESKNEPAPGGESTLRTFINQRRWVLLPPGDAALTRRVKSAGDYWAVQEKKGRKTFSRGVWAPAETIERIRADLTAERSTDSYAKRRAADARRRDKAQAEYVEDFRGAVVAFLDFHPAHAELAEQMATAVAAHATPVGSGTVARTKRIPVEQRAEAAVIAWMRHQTTAYDSMSVPRVKGKRREIRRLLAGRSRELLDGYRRGDSASAACPLRRALNELAGSAEESRVERREARVERRGLRAEGV
eukprot:g21455.t1